MSEWGWGPGGDGREKGERKKERKEEKGGGGLDRMV